MTRQRLVILDAEQVLRLLCHYVDGKSLPMDVELEGVGVS